jgi:UDP-3-O-[3-hydroxymyristoyl] N-acetylglucosamine deacetylase
MLLFSELDLIEWDGLAPGAAIVSPSKRKQRTLRESISFSGKGLHNGLDSRVRIDPAPENSGITFGYNSAPPLRPAYACLANSTTTAICGEDAILCVEHFLACLHGLSITNAAIRVEGGNELPILDGSGRLIVEQISRIGIIEQQTTGYEVRIAKNVAMVHPDGRSIKAAPSDKLQVEAEIQFPAPIGRQHKGLDITEDTFLREVAPARTFLQKSISDIPLAEVQANRLFGLDVNEPQLIFYDNDGFKVPLRFDDECIRHKVLDFMGDTFTGGFPIVGSFSLMRPGHAFTLAFIRALMRAAVREPI